MVVNLDKQDMETIKACYAGKGTDTQLFRVLYERVKKQMVDNMAMKKDLTGKYVLSSVGKCVVFMVEVVPGTRVQETSIKSLIARIDKWVIQAPNPPAAPPIMRPTIIRAPPYKMMVGLTVGRRLEGVEFVERDATNGEILNYVSQNYPGECPYCFEDFPLGMMTCMGSVRVKHGSISAKCMHVACNKCFAGCLRGKCPICDKKCSIII